MNDSMPGFAQDYAAALREYLMDAREAARHQAYELGRQALQTGVGLLDIALLHHEAFRAVAGEPPAGDEPIEMRRAAEFLAECLSSFEMTLRGYQETNKHLVALNQVLALSNETIKTANENLAAEMVERQRAEEALRKAQKLEAVGRLAGGIAHNFNNLFTVVLGNLDRALRQVAEDEPLGRLLAKVERAAERGTKVTQFLLAFSRQHPLAPWPIEPSSRLRDLADLLGGSLRGDIAVATDIPDDLWTVEVDPSQLEMALFNLGFNARDAMPNGGVLEITATNRTVQDERLDLDGDYVVIQVCDNGSGIPSDVLPRVFDPFFTTKDVGAGTGLGLSQVHGFAHQSGGAIDIESALGKGTIVTLYLPAARELVPTKSTKGAQPNQHRAKGTVLVVEDDVDVAEIAGGVLQQCGFDVKLVHRARPALEILRAGAGIDVVFSDILMPDGMSGIELAEEVRRQFPEIPVLLTTGYSEAAASANLKGFRIIAKPFRSKELCDSVSGVLRTRQA